MKKAIFILIFLISSVAEAATPSLSVKPENVLQGEPFLATVNDTTGVKRITFAGRAVEIFLYQNKPTALVGVDLHKKPGQYKFSVELKDGQKLDRTVDIIKREKLEAPLDIPEKLGGNTEESRKTLISTLALENASINNIRSGKKIFWKEKFSFPIKDPVVTDGYGYSRLTGSYSIAHKGTDFKAQSGTAVTAMNRGVVRIARTYRNYGKTIVVDHGLGLATLYMHLSKIRVNEGELVLPGQLIGNSGESGYATGPHLHVSVKIKGVSVDPMKFLALFRD